MQEVGHAYEADAVEGNCGYKGKSRPDLNLDGGRSLSIAKPSSPDCLLQAMQPQSDGLRCAHLRSGLPNVQGREGDTPASLSPSSRSAGWTPACERH